MNANDIWLIAGLGNPESKYDGTRHNAGFAALDHLAGKWGIAVSKTKWYIRKHQIHYITFLIFLLLGHNNKLDRKSVV